MEIHTYEIKLDGYTEPWRIYPIGDIHYTSMGCDRLALARDIARIKNDPNAYWYGMGDYDEYITYGDPRFDPTSFNKQERIDFLKSMGEKQTRKIVTLFEPISDRCLGIGEGNHELEYGRRHDHDPAREIADRLKVKFLSYEALTRIYISGRDKRKRYSLVVYTHHGWGGGSTPGAALNRMARLVISWDADIYITGHDHQLSSTVKPRLGISIKGQFTDRPIALIQSGTYLKTKQPGIQGYEVKRGHQPTSIGCSGLEIQGNNKGNFSVETKLKHHTTI